MKRSTSLAGQTGGRGTATHGVSSIVRGIGSRAAAGPFAEPIGPANDALEREADRIAEVVVHVGLLQRPGRGGWSAATAPDETIQGKCVECEQEEEEKIRRAPKETGVEVAAGSAPVAVPPVPKASPEPAAYPNAAVPEISRAEPTASETASALLVDDYAEATRGQMRKSEFMATLRVEVCATVDAALTGTGRGSQGCPWIDHWLGYYDGRSASQIERSLHRYAPEAAGVSTAGQYIRIVAARVRKSAERWGRTGEITGMPDDMPVGAMPGGSLLAGFGGMFFKARPGGPRQANAASVRQQLGGGESLPGGLRARMEGAFGSSFAGVRLHNDATAARLSSHLNARAFAIGPHVAFAGGEFRPGTLTGDALIAHELAHVVQQGHGNAAPTPLHKDYEAGFGGPSDDLEHDADSSAAGVTASLWDSGSFADVKRQAKPRLHSGLQLQRCASTPRTSTGPQAKAKLSAREEKDAAIADAGDRLRSVEAWASMQKRVQGVRDVKGVSGLDKDQATNVEQAIEMLTRANALLGTKTADALPAKLDEIVLQVKAAKTLVSASGGDELDLRARRQQSQLAINKAIEVADEATNIVGKVGQTLDVTEVSKHTDAIAATLNSMSPADPATVYDGAEAVIQHVKAAKRQLAEQRSLSDRTPKSLERILFVLRSFLALNAPGRATPPSADEVKAYAGKLRGNLADDFSTVFGKGLVTHGFDVFVGYADVLEDQLAVRAKMAAAKVDAASPVPTQGNAEDYFKSLRGRKNEEVFDAYTAYAAAFFFHRVVDKFNDMDVSGVSELYERPLSIFGVRPLVCTGYALLGSHLLTKAGAKLKEFIVAVRATDDDIVNDKIDAGHALAHMNRNGREFWVSNHLIVFTEDGGIGENAVAWGNSRAKLRKATGPTIPGANKKLGSVLGDLAEKLEKKRASQRK